MDRTTEFMPNFKRLSILNITIRSTNPRIFPQAIKASGDFPSRTRRGANLSETFPLKRRRAENQKSSNIGSDTNNLSNLSRTISIQNDNDLIGPTTILLINMTDLDKAINPETTRSLSFWMLIVLLRLLRLPNCWYRCRY